MKFRVLILEAACKRVCWAQSIVRQWRRQSSTTTIPAWSRWTRSEFKSRDKCAALGQLTVRPGMSTLSSSSPFLQLELFRMCRATTCRVVAMLKTTLKTPYQLLVVYIVPVLRIRIRCLFHPWSGIRDRFFPDPDPIFLRALWQFFG